MRPLSPHLQIYKPQSTSMMSILHRITGMVLSLGLLPFVYWLHAIANGEASYQSIQMVFNSTLGIMSLIAWSFALFYHLCNGIRHLFWDAGLGFDLKQAYRSGYLVLFSTILLTIVTWTVIFWETCE
jgi:succinate dehydrogenase / fumarate reductase cytochrome b subunit